MAGQGIVLGGSTHKIDGYCSIDWTNKVEVQAAIDLFGYVDIGLALPAAWADAGSVWDVTRSGIEGGHCVAAVGYDATGGHHRQLGQALYDHLGAFLSRKWIEEAYAVLAPEWYSVASTAPNGVNLAALKADLAALAAGDIPSIAPTPVPVVPPTPVTPVTPPTPVPVVVGLTLP